MHFTAFSTASLIFTTALAGALDASTKVNTKSSCLTLMGTKSVRPVSTKGTTSTENLPVFTITYTSRPKTTVTPTKTIILTKWTLVKTTKTLSTSTNVITTTESVTNTATITDVYTSTNLVFAEAVVTETMNHAVPTPDGFHPVADTMQRPNKIKRVEVRPAAVKALLERGNKDPGVQCNEFPQSVQCKTIVQKRIIKTAVVTGKPITITARRSLVFSTTTKTITKTSIQAPGKVTSTATVSSTDTITATETLTTSTDVTTTTTVTTTSIITSYAACATNNLLSQVDGLKISNGYNNGGASTGSTFSSARADTALECCEICQQTANCQGTFFSPGRCLILYSAQGICATTAYAGYYVASSNGGYTVGNGPCGYFSYNGPGS
ncbi:hypothetical protein EJ02DRAFT_467108 [Clathrospora elynae]|uniref:Apple domain-containing protein n=1 Tax=Clathrospora elynae TaxID=706981 RepID=A0A6A5SMF4_9PLEO|nr:hypothetical protein EJ02DRAFT_467108 [Clathrospora elynae]